MPEQVTFDHYELLTRDDGSPFELGRGAMGITYKAFDTNLRIPVALKVINVPGLQSEAAREQFVQEARSAARLRHRNVASVFHLGMEGDTYFYAMEFIDGETVECLLKRSGPLPPLVALRIALQVARALHAAELQGLVHRDIKPSNLMLVQEDDELCAKVIDFGLAQTLRIDEETPARTQGSTAPKFAGTPQFASPEQLEERPVDVRSDIYSLGATLWFMLAGEPPFFGPLARVVGQQLWAEPPFEKLSTTPPEVVTLLRKMLQKDPSARFQTATELRHALEECLHQVAGGPGAAAARLALEEARVSAAGQPPRASGEAAVGERLAGRYEVLAGLGQTNTGWLYHAREIARGTEVRLLVLEVGASDGPAVFAQMEQEVARLRAAEHPNLLRVFDLEAGEATVLLALEWTRGCTLLQVLRSRRKLPAAEVLRLLEPMAAAVDHVLAHGLSRLGLALHQVFLDFDPPPDTPDEFARTPLSEWPPWQLKVNPLSITPTHAETATWGGEMTMAGGNLPSPSARLIEPEEALTRELALLTYELLGGAVTPMLAVKAGAQGVARYSPLANLTEEGNEVLRAALDPARSFRSAMALYRALADLGALETHAPEAAAAVVSAAPKPAPTVRDKASQTIPPVAPVQRPPWSAFAIGAVLLALLGLAAFVWLRPSPKLPSNESPADTASVTPSTPPPTLPAAPRAGARPRDSAAPRPA